MDHKSLSNKNYANLHTFQAKASNSLTWKAETNKEDREERSVEEARYSPNQKSDLIANWQETTINIQ